MSKKLQLPFKNKARQSPASVPPDKRRKTDADIHGKFLTPQDHRNDNIDLWNDDLDDLPEDVLEDFEIMASQAYEQKQTQSHDFIQTHASTVDSIPKPIQNRQSLSVGKGKPRSNSMPTPNSQDSSSRNNAPNTSSLGVFVSTIGNNNTLLRKNEICSQNKHSVCSYPQTRVSDACFSNPTLGSTGSGKISPSLPTSQGKTNTDQHAILQREVERLKKECESQKAEMNRQKKDKYGLEGQIKMLRESLTQKDTDLSRQKQERQSQIEQQIKQRKEKEKSLQHEVDRLKIQLQFKEQEALQSQQTCGRLERQLKQGQGSSPDKSFHSPKADKYEMVSPRSKSHFPTRETFMAKHNVKMNARDASIQVDMITKLPDSDDKTSKKKRKANEKPKFPSGIVSGSGLMSKLMNSPPDGVSVFGLLQSGIRTQDASRSQHEPFIPETSRSQPAKLVARKNMPIVNTFGNTENISLAYQGLSTLLQSNSTMELTAEIQEQCSCDVADVVLVLPAIDDFLSEYLVTMETWNDSPSTSSSSSSSKTACSTTTVDSVTVSMKSLLTHEYDPLAGLVNRTMNALQLLHKLVCYSPHVRSAILSMEANETDSRNEETTVSGKKKKGQLSGDTVGRPNLKPTKILQRVIQMCSLSHPCVYSNDSNKIVEDTLGVLSALCKHSSIQNLTCLQPLLTLGVIKNCLDSGRSDALIQAALDVLIQMLPSESLMSLLCHMPEYCVLSSLYSVCIRTRNDNTPKQSTWVHQKVLQLLSGIISVHRRGAAILLDNDCQCSVEVVECIILMLHQGLHHYKECGGDASLAMLRQGIRLLQGMKQFDAMYLDHHLDVEHQYVDILCTLNVVFRKQPHLYEHEISILQDLTDFDQDDPDSEPDDTNNMDTA